MFINYLPVGLLLSFVFFILSMWGSPAFADYCDCRRDQWRDYLRKAFFAPVFFTLAALTTCLVNLFVTGVCGIVLYATFNLVGLFCFAGSCKEYAEKIKREQREMEEWELLNEYEAMKRKEEEKKTALMNDKVMFAN